MTIPLKTRLLGADEHPVVLPGLTRSVAGSISPDVPGLPRRAPLTGRNCGRRPIAGREGLTQTRVPMLRVALLDDHPAVLAGLRRLIDAEPDLKVAAIAASAPDLARALDGRRPDVLILDYDLARDDGLAHCRRIKSRPNPPAVIIYSAYAGPAVTLAARVAQADGLVDKAAPVRTLLSAVRRAAGGDIVMSPVSPDAFAAAVARLDDDDLPVFAMLVDREPLESIAEALRVDRGEVSRRAHRIAGRLRPRLAINMGDRTVHAREVSEAG
jgi:DNA-binding NarL/FixJ family response regulator